MTRTDKLVPSFIAARFTHLGALNLNDSFLCFGALVGCDLLWGSGALPLLVYFHTLVLSHEVVSSTRNGALWDFDSLRSDGALTSHGLIRYFGALKVDVSL